MLDVNGKLDFDTMLEMHKRGHTRIPVCDGDPTNPQTPIVGLMLTKDLMLVDPEDEVPITALLQFCGRDILAVPVSSCDTQTKDATTCVFVQCWEVSNNALITFEFGMDFRRTISA